MATEQLYSADTERKYCPSCKRLHPITDFRWENKAKGTRHRQCRTCRRERMQARRKRETQKTVRKGVRRLRRVETLEALYNWLELLAYEVGGLKRLAEIWVEMMTSEDVPFSYRTTLLRSILHMFAVFDNALATQSSVKSSGDLKKMHKGQLIQWIRELRYEGYLTVDDVDPSPGDWSGFEPH